MAAWLTEGGLELLRAGPTVTAAMPSGDAPADRIVASALARNTAAKAPVLNTMDNTIRQLRTDDRICKDDGNRETTITDLAQAARTGDRAAWDEIVFRYDGVVRATVARYRLQQSDAANATQNTLWGSRTRSRPLICGFRLRIRTR